MTSRLLHLVCKEPGCTVRQAARRLGVNPRTAGSRARRLAHLHQIKIFRSERGIHLMPAVPGLGGCWRQVVALRDPELARFYENLPATPIPKMQKTLTELAVDLVGWSGSTTQRKLGILEEAGLIRRFKRRPYARETCYQKLPLAAPAFHVLTVEADSPSPGIFPPQPLDVKPQATDAGDHSELEGDLQMVRDPP